MKVVRFLVPGSENFSVGKLIVKKVLPTLVITLVLSSVPINTARDLSTIDYGIESATANPIRLGLSRRRGAFNKAIDMLANAAGVNERLAGYYARVTKRVKGRHADGENSSGVEVVKAVRSNSSGRLDARAINSASGPLVASAQSASIAEPRSAASSSEMSGDWYDPGAPPQLTVGDMTFDTNPAIEHWLNYYSVTPVGRQTLKIGIERSNSYLEMARAEFRNAGVPEDLVWLACVESVWNPRAVSTAAAGGIWQFIPATATDYGLTVRTGNDERADPLKQTRVAAVYLRDLYTIFGDWALAMAAYNSGEPRVMGAIVKNGNADYWELCEKELLPKETRDYVPKILATIKLAGQAGEYGLVPQTAIPSGS